MMEENAQVEPKEEEQKSLYDQLHHDLENDSEAKEEVTLGKRVGLYRIKSTKLGAGNFSVVKLGIHLLTNGGYNDIMCLCMFPRL